MLEVRNLTKIYSGKGGVSVRALDDVSVVFPEKGMVFLLGKSGSGKSTLLNVAGGLDKPDGGEIIVKGKSSRDFSGSDFDSYRNTFIGFVFQEYNILNEFTIEQNIALALQLQSKPNDKKAVNDLLEQVDLAGYAKRKPNTLSGGQKQRVAIARALIKQPEIIMADEPTGALDSNTGKQVLDTLKKLSETKLVIVVSHDREFAEYYGDRIIELKDGKIISDVTKVYYTPSNLAGEKIESFEETMKDAPETDIASAAGAETGTSEAAAPAENVAVISENTIAIRDGESLTDEEVKKIGEMLRSQKGEVIITADQSDLPGVKRACKINDNGNKESFKETGPVEAKQYDGKKTKFIKSHLPIGHAIKMGASGLKSKPIRLIFTILLAVAAFILFGVASTFMFYDPNYSVSEAMISADYPAATITKAYTVKVSTYKIDENGEKELDYDWDNEYTTRFGASEVASRSKNGLDFAGVFNFTDYSYNNYDSGELTVVDGTTYITPNLSAEKQNYYVVSTTVGFSDCSADYMTRNGMTLIAGTHPNSASQVALPSYLAELFISEEGTSTIRNANDLIGKKIRFSFNAISSELFTISGVYKVGTIPEKYDALKATPGSPMALNEKEKEKLQASFSDYLLNSFNLVVFVTPEFYNAYKASINTSSNSYASMQQEYYKNIYFNIYENGWYPDNMNDYQYGFYTDKTLQVYGANAIKFYDVNGNAVTYNNQISGIYLSTQRFNDIRSNVLNEYFYRVSNNLRYAPDAKAEAEESNLDNKINNSKDGGYAVKVAFMKKWQSKIFSHYCLYRCAQALNDSGSYNSGAFHDAFEAIRAYVDNYQDDAVPTDAMWTTLENTVNSDLSEQARFGYMIEALRNLIAWNALLGDEEDNVIYEAKNGTLSAEDFAGYKTKVNNSLAAKGCAAYNGTTAFAFLENVVSLNNRNIYYKDKTGDGEHTLPILGYFETGMEWGPEYFLSENFLFLHATYMSDMSGEYRVTVEETDYVVPVDAKYNYLITPTDNSRAQISAILDSEEGTVIGIRSSVYQELQWFLELIEELEKIFLYVGLGVGLLAAFFLLNFISVSISTKKKDIGILRAVGARGSDVFKIFYAESFIIAAICFVLATIGSYVVCMVLNNTMVEVVSMKLLNFGIINTAIVLGSSLIVSVIATFFPVFFAARKSPVEAIRAL